LAGELKNKFIYQLILSGSQVLLPLISYPYITRILGPVNLGKINYVDFLGQLFIIFAAFGIPFYAIREIAVVRNDAAKRALLIQEIVLLHSFFALLAAFIFILATVGQWSSSPLLYIFALANILLSAYSFEWYLQGMEAFRFAAIRTIVIRIGMLVAFFLLIKNARDYPYYSGVFTTGFLLMAVINGYKVVRDNHFVKQPLQLRKHLRPLWHFFLTTSAISIYIYFDTILLQQLTHNEQAVGYYTTIIKLVKICLVVLLTVGSVLMPRLSFLASTGNTTAVKTHLDKSLLFIVTLGIPISAGLYLLAPEIIAVIAGEAFLPAVPVMKILALLPLAIGLSNLFCFQTLIPFNKEKIFLRAVIIGSIISVSLNILLIPHLAEKGAAWANIITEIIISVITGWYAYKIIRFAIPRQVIVQTIITCLFFLPLIVFCRLVFNSSLYILITAISGCVLLYGVVQYFLFRNAAVREIMTFVFQILKPKS
jgi:O-antigen/teichoic acid export membrane protein